jgi:Rrf2 family protein
MTISAKTEYACIAVMELAARFGSPEPVRIRQIADAHGIPSRFLVQILLQLKGAGLVTSTRGAAGGYQLLKDPAEITLADVMGVIEGQNHRVTSNLSEKTPASSALVSAWQEAANAEQDVLSSVTFADLVERVRGQNQEMYYI